MNIFVDGKLYLSDRDKIVVAFTDDEIMYLMHARLHTNNGGVSIAVGPEGSTQEEMTTLMEAYSAEVRKVLGIKKPEPDGTGPQLKLITDPDP